MEDSVTYNNHWVGAAISFAMIFAGIFVIILKRHRSRRAVFAFLNDRSAVWWGFGAVAAHGVLSVSSLTSGWRNVVSFLAGGFVRFFIVGTVIHYFKGKAPFEIAGDVDDDCGNEGAENEENPNYIACRISTLNSLDQENFWIRVA
jgi:hypothetical protein